MSTYHIVINSKDCGPFTVEQLLAAGLTPDSYVWTSGLTKWTHASEIPELCEAFKSDLEPELPEPEAAAAEPAQADAVAEPDPVAVEPQPEPEVVVVVPEPKQQVIAIEPNPEPIVVVEPPAAPNYREVPEPATFAVEPPAEPMLSAPKSWLPESVLVTLLFLPLGVVALVKAFRVSSLWNNGEYQEAYAKSQSAKRWVIATLITGPVIYFIFMIVYLVFIMVEAFGGGGSAHYI